MQYLDCMEMLNYALETLKDGQRVQVPTSKMSDLMTIILRVSDRIGNEQSLSFKTTKDDLLQAILVVQEMKSVSYLNDSIKQTLIEGFKSLKVDVARLAYPYYSLVDFEPTEEVIPLMRDVVKMYSQGGGVI